jgi:uncharacterized protein YjbJ (UPF0337 family)
VQIIALQLTPKLEWFRQEANMNWDVIEGKWKQFKGGVKVRWGKFTDDDLDQIQGQREKLIGKVQERYGHNRAEAEKQVEEWQKQAKEIREDAQERSEDRQDDRKDRRDDR